MKIHAREKTVTGHFVFEAMVVGTESPRVQDAMHSPSYWFVNSSCCHVFEVVTFLLRDRASHFVIIFTGTIHFFVKDNAHFVVSN